MSMISGDLEEFCSSGQSDYYRGFDDGIILSLKILSKYPEIKDFYKKEFRKRKPGYYLNVESL